MSMQAREQRRYSEQAVTVSGVGSGPGVLHRSVSAPNTSRRGSSLGLIACLDEEQMRGMPSSSEIWRKKEMSMRDSTASLLCPCLSQLLEQQVEENRRIQSSNQNTLTLVGTMYLYLSIDQYSLSQAGRIDDEQKTVSRRQSLSPKSSQNLVSLLDED